MLLSRICCVAALAFATASAPAQTQSSGVLTGKVVFANSGAPIHKARILIAELGRGAETAEDGTFSFRSLPPGEYHVVARLAGLSDVRTIVKVAAGETATLELELGFEPLRQQITVTASGREETAFETFQAVTTVESIDLVQRAQTSIGDVLDNEPGVAKRSFGPGSSRPVLRGFDGDRVLVMQDGMPTGSLSSQSADHGEAVDVLELERLEVVKGPATLLYGSSALGGVVNAVTRYDHLREHPHEGFSGYASGIGGTTNEHGGGGAGLEYGNGKWSVWGSGGGQRTGDYSTPIGEVNNSKTRIVNGSGGFGLYGTKRYLSLNLGVDDARYGIPFATAFEGGGDPVEADEDEHIDLGMRIYNARLTTGLRDLTNPFVESVQLGLDLVNYSHREIEVADGTETIGTAFQNRYFGYRGVLKQRRRGQFSGTIGFAGYHRNYDTVGEEALAPPIDQNNFAVFGLEEIAFEPLRVQLGGRIEHNAYSPIGLPARSFTGFSGAAGVHLPLWRGGAFVANYTHAYRAPALEELYNNGPHIGNLTFEIGNPDLRRERSNGIDLSLRQQAKRFNLEANFFYYDIGDFIFLAPTGLITDNLIEAEHLQASSRYVGGEISASVNLHPTTWLHVGMDMVDAELTSAVASTITGFTTPSGTPLPRIPPVRGRASLDWRYKGLSLRPEIIVAGEQDQVFTNETRTAGYTLINVGASYTMAEQHLVQVFSVEAFNLADRLYRNHLSFIKDLAPEIGRGVRFGYTVRFN